jgi:nucleoid DNA-binding protein
MVTKKTTTQTAAKAPAKKAPVKQTAAKEVAAKKVPVKKVAAKKVATKQAAPAGRKAAAPAAKKAASVVKDTFTKASLQTYLAEQTQVDPKTVKAVLAALEATMLGAVHKRGAGEFTLPGLLKVTVQAVPAKKRRFGKDPFTGEDRWFDAKPASVRIKTRALKKLKDAAA